MKLALQLILVLALSLVLYLIWQSPIINPPRQEVSIYFSQAQDNEIVQVPVKRIVPRYQEPMTYAIKALIEGPTAEEKAQGLGNSLNAGTKLNYIQLSDGVATLDFNERFDTPMGGSARVMAIYQELFRTMTQFPEVREIKLTINNGQREAVLEP